MLRFTAAITASILIASLDAPCLWGRGGGGFHGSGFGYRGGAFGGGDFAGGLHAGFGQSDDLRGGLDRGEFGGLRRDDDARGDSLRYHLPLPTDAGFGHAVSARDFTPTGHLTRAVSNGAMADRARRTRNSFWHYDYFRGDWWRDHPSAWFAAGWTAAHAWDWATWPAIGAWYGWGDAAGIYYDYGTNINYQGDQVYYGDTSVASADQYFQQASDLAQRQPADAAAPGDWQPLGVFGLVQQGQTGASAVFQLATNKAGAIAGNFNDLLTGATLRVRGAVDRQTQRASWTVGDNKQTVYDTGIYNLTQPQSPLLVHFGQDRTQQWLLVRLQQPATDAADADRPDQAE